MKLKMSKKSLLAIGMLLMIAGGSLAAVAFAVPTLTSNIVHVSVSTAPSYQPTLEVIQEGDQISTILEAKTVETQVSNPPYGLFKENVTGPHGTLYYNTVGTTFDVSFAEGDGLLSPSTGYSLVYYADPSGWSGDGTIIVLATGTSTPSGSLSIGPTTTSIATNLPAPGDANFGMGAKIWLVPSSDVSGTSLTWVSYPTGYLFETELVHYHQVASASNTVDLWATVPTPLSATFATLDTNTPSVTVHFWVNVNGGGWVEIGTGTIVTWEWYCGFAGTIQYGVGTTGEYDFKATIVGGGTTITITPPYKQTYP